MFVYMHKYMLSIKMKSLESIDINHDQHDIEMTVKIFFSFIHLFMCAHIVWAIFSPCSPFPTSPPTPLASKLSLFSPFLQFCWRVDISNNKKDKAFLLVEIRIAIQRDS
jgi:hypothetical protein